MNKCFYNYKGVDYSSKEELIEKLKSDKNKSHIFNVKGNRDELLLQEELIKLEAEDKFGTSEHISFEYRDNDLVVSINEDNIKNFNSDSTVLLNLKTGLKELVDLNDPNNNETTHTNYTEAKIQQIAEKSTKDIVENQIPQLIKALNGDENLKNKLVNFANRLGIKFETLENYLKSKIDREQLEDIDDINALADIFEKTIALSDNATLEDLVEEVSHFAIELNVGTNTLEKMISKVNETQEYKENETKYRLKYKGDERKVRIEVLGKILANKVKDKFSSESATTLVEKGIIEQLRDLWENFLKIFRESPFLEEFGSIIDGFANNILEDSNKSPISLTNSKEIYFSIRSKGGIQRDVLESLENIVSDLQERYRSIRRNNPVQNQKTETTLNEIRDRLATASFAKAINAVVSLIESDVKQIEAIIEKTNGNLEEEIRKSDILELITFINNIPNTLTSLTVVIDSMSKDMQFSTNDNENNILKDKLLKEIRSIQSRATRVSNEMSPFISQRAVEIVEEELDKENVTDEKIRALFIRPVISGVYSEINSFVKKVFAFSKVGNYTFKIINNMFVTVDSKVRQAVTDFINDFRNIELKYDTDGSDILIKSGSMINPFHILKVEAYIKEQIDKIVEEYDLKISETTNNKEKEILEKEKLAAVRKKTLSYQVKKTDISFEDTMDKLDLSENTRKNIKARSNAKFKILLKYTNKDSSINYSAITNKDLIDLENIDAAYKSDLSEWDTNGERKEGNLLKLALELKKYRDSFTKQNEKFAVEKFEKEKDNILNKIVREKGVSRTQAFQDKEFIFWARNNARYDYDLIIRSQLDEQSSNVKIISLKGGYNSENILSEVDMKGLDLEMVTQDELLTIYEKLTEKRKQLVAPYKINGEIDVKLLNRDELLVDTINHLNNIISQFKVETEVEGKYKIQTRGNKHFKERLEELEHSPREKNAFIKETGAINVDGEWIPTLYQYKSYYLVDEAGNEIGKKYVPNYKYALKEETGAQINPKYVKELAGKTVQYDLEHPELQEFIQDEDFYNFFGIDKKDDPYGLKKGATRNKGVWELRQFLLDSKEEIDKNIYHESYSYFKLPQVVASVKELKDKGTQVFNAAFETSFLDVSGNEESSIGKADRIIIPKRYNRPLTSQEILTSDISKMFGSYYEHGIKYKEQNAILPKILVLVESIKKGSLDSGGEMAQSNLYGMLKTQLSAQLYGNLVEEADWLTNFLNIFSTSKRVSGAKVLRATAGFISKTNLGFSTVTPVVGTISSFLDNMKLFMSDNMVDRASYTYSLKEAANLMKDYWTDMGSNKPTSKGKKLMEYFPLNITNKEMLDGIAKSKLYRSISDPSMMGYELAGIGSALQAVIASTHSHRLMSDGKFHNINSWREANKERDSKELEKEFKEASKKSYYTYLNTDSGRTVLDKNRIIADGFQGDIEALENKMFDITSKYWAKIENQAVALDKPQLYLNPYMMFMGIHSQWLFNFMQSRFMSKQYMLDASRWEEGSYRTVFSAFMNSLTDKNIPLQERLFNVSKLVGSMTTLGWYSRGMEGLEEYEKTNLRQFSMDIYMWGVTFAVMVILNLSADDDEEDTVKQYMAYIATRALTEQGASAFPFAFKEMYKKAKEPVIGLNYIDMMMNLPLLVTEEGGEEIERGKYKGLTKRKKAMLQMLVLKNLYTPYKGAEGYRNDNMFMRSTAFGIEKHWYEKIQESTEE
jgi:hypothetical protein